MDFCEVLVIGAGPAGLGAAWRLHELGFDSWSVAEASGTVGGLSASVVDERGFTWDLGGHILFSHYGYFDGAMDAALGEAWVEHVREAWVWMRERFIPYPLQNNIWRLPDEDLIACLEGLLAVHAGGNGQAPRTFREWILRHFGSGLAEVFMLPYNRKVWAFDPEQLGTGWVGERVATVDLGRVLRNLVLRQDDCGWGPNARFRFPQRGGTGAIWSGLCRRLPVGRVRLNKRLERLSSRERVAHFADGTSLRYRYLVSTMPLDLLLRGLTDRPELAAEAAPLQYSSCHVVGVGIEGRPPESLATKCWMYFPEEDVPFYRVTVFSNYSPENVPDPARQWSLLCEVSESRDKPVDSRRVTEDVVAGLRRAQLIPDGARLSGTWHRRLEHAYPTPSLGRDAALQRVDGELTKAGIWSRGRFGAWKYEVGNQDHSFMQGVEAVDHILLGTEELTYRCPNVVNAAKGDGRRTPARSLAPMAPGGLPHGERSA